jgi:hydrogenase-4 component F
MSYLGADTHKQDVQHEKRFYASANMFLLAMTCVFLCNNLGYLWICVAGTTLFSAPLIYFDRTKNAVEAARKYLIICGVGMAFALIGTILLFAGSQHAGPQLATLRIDGLIDSAKSMDVTLLRLGFCFCLLGYGTNAGVFPLHNWLSDAHSEAPAPVCAMLSGSLLNCALYAIYKIFQIVIASQALHRMEEIVLAMGALTALAASLLLIRQHNFKRIWAYSSVGNVGIMLMCIALGSGPLFLFQAVNHSLAKVSLFLLSGNVIQASGTKRLSGLHGLIESQPMWAALLALAACASTGCPPFGAFASELKLLMATANPAQWPWEVLLLVAISISFIAVCSHLGHTLCGTAKTDFVPHTPVRASVIPALLVLSSLLLGLLVPQAFWTPYFWSIK